MLEPVFGHDKMSGHYKQRQYQLPSLNGVLRKHSRTIRHAGRQTRCSTVVENPKRSTTNHLRRLLGAFGYV